MKITLAVLAALTLAGIGGISAAHANTQPTQGYASTGRNDAGFGGGPHCHINVVASEHNPTVDFVAVFPSHTAHVNTGLPGEVFLADPNCDGDPGL